MGIFSDHLKELRGSRSQAEIAKSIGITQQKWQRLESGKNEPDLKLLHIICVTLGVSADTLLGLAPKQSDASPTASAPGIKTRVAELKTKAENVSGKADDLLKSIKEMEEAL